jgi:hypothetical protein
VIARDGTQTDARNVRYADVTAHPDAYRWISLTPAAAAPPSRRRALIFGGPAARPRPAAAAAAA